MFWRWFLWTLPALVAGVALNLKGYGLAPGILLLWLIESRQRQGSHGAQIPWWKRRAGKSLVAPNRFGPKP